MLLKLKRHYHRVLAGYNRMLSEDCLLPDLKQKYLNKSQKHYKKLMKTYSHTFHGGV